MSDGELLFIASLLADNVYIDKKWLADPINHRWYLKVKNQSGITLWFKLFNTVANWDFGTSLPGSDEKELGSVASGVEAGFQVDMARDVPAGEVVDTGDFTLKAYSDSGYSVLVAQATLPIIVNIEDLESWSSKQVYDFDDGTEQGWTLSNLSVQNDKSVEVGGYSLKGSHGDPEQTCELSKSISLPNKNRVRVAFFLAYRFYNPSAIEYHTLFVRNAKILVDDVEVFWIPEVETVYIRDQTLDKGWFKLTGDVSASKNGTHTIKIRVGIGSDHFSMITSVWIDRVVIVGED